MVDVVMEFFQIVGADPEVIPETLAELIPYLFRVMVGVFLFSGVFGVIGKIVEIFTNYRKF